MELAELGGEVSSLLTEHAGSTLVELIAIYGDEPARAGARPAKRTCERLDDALVIPGDLAAIASQFEGSGEFIAVLCD